MWLSLLIGALVIFLLFKLLLRSEDDHEQIPGPSITSLIWSVIAGDARKTDGKRIHLTLTDMARKYGPIMKLPELTGKGTIVVSDYDHIYQVYVTKGKDVGGRLSIFRFRAMFCDTGIAFREEPDEKWKKLRKIAHSHLRQFGKGMTVLQGRLNKVGAAMFEEFAKRENVPFDPKDIIEEITLKSIVFLVTGRIPEGDDQILSIMTKIEQIGRDLIANNSSFAVRLQDAFPWLRHIGLSPTWTRIKEWNALQDELMNLLSKQYQSDPEKDSFYKVFLKMIETDDSIDSLDLQKTLIDLLIGGTVTSKETFYSIINLLAHSPHVQEKMFDEIQNVVPKGEQVDYSARHQLNYCKAVLFEAFRYHNVAALGLLHRTCVTTRIGNYTIPAHTKVIPLLWRLHHDPEFWKDPEHFRPERFMDAKGEVFPVDHPARQHLMPFGAGARMCVAESMATARQFLWMTSLVRRFTVTPVGSKDKRNNPIDLKNYTFDIVTTSPSYEVIFKERRK